MAGSPVHKSTARSRVVAFYPSPWEIEDNGHVLAEQHARIPSAEVDGWLPVVPNWPRLVDLQHLPRVVDDPKLLARVDRALRRRADTMYAVDDPVLVHADLGLHNIALDPVSHRLVGLFDYEGAAFGDRHQDFAYMIFQRNEEPMLDGAIGAYERATGVQIDRDRVRLLNAVAAIGFLAFRPLGRTRPSTPLACRMTATAN